MSDVKQVALVTGASRGIGRAIATTLAAQGFTVIGTATTDAGAAAITDALAPHGGRGLRLDVNDAAAVDAADAVTRGVWGWGCVWGTGGGGGFDDSSQLCCYSQRPRRRYAPVPMPRARRQGLRQPLRTCACAQAR